MTRETKVGLIVAGSFLCLVCIVVASKMRHGDDPTNGNSEEQTAPQVAAAKPTQNTHVPEAKKKEVPAKSAQSSVVLPPSPERTDVPNFPPLVSLPSKDKEVVTLPPPNIGALTFPPIESKPSEPVLPPVVNPGELKIPPVTPAQVVQAKDEKDRVLPPPQVFSFPPNSFPAIEEKKPEAVKPITLEMPPLVFGKPDSRPDPAKPLVKPDSVLTFPPLAKEPSPAVIVPFNEKDPPNPTAKLPTFPANPTEPVVAVPTIPKDPAPVLPPTARDPALPVLPPLGLPMPLPKDVNVQAPSITIPADPIKPGVALVPNSPLTPTGPTPRIPGAEAPNPAIPSFSSAGKPMPIIRDTDVYLCQLGDTNFAILSQRLYGTDKYADALLQYNRHMYKATVNGSVFLNDTPALVQGQQVHVAPTNILDRDYRPFIRTANVTPVPTIPAAAPLLSKPMPLSPGIATISNPPGSGQARTYTVQSANGESILDIAERVMGDRGQWHKIWRVNPSYPPQFRIPAGTKLEIPAN